MHVVLAMLMAIPAAQGAPPVLLVEAPPELQGVAAGIEGAPPDRLARVMTLIGLADAGGPIRVHVLPEESPLARDTPSWIVGLARPADGRILLFPARASSYPNASLEDVFLHEVAHVLIGRAAGWRPMPRWFNEGLAMAAERPRTLEDRARLAIELALRPKAPLDRIEGWFSEGPRRSMRAYALAGALVDDLLERHGPQSGAEILASMRIGRRFDEAFRLVTGRTPLAHADQFWARSWLHRWVPLATSPFVLWMAVTLLALLAIGRHRARRAAQRRQWEEEEAGDDRSGGPFVM